MSKREWSVGHYGAYDRHALSLTDFIVVVETYDAQKRARLCLETYGDDTVDAHSQEGVIYLYKLKKEALQFARDTLNKALAELDQLNEGNEDE